MGPFFDKPNPEKLKANGKSDNNEIERFVVFI
jgi:hypothetical protein